MIEEKDIIDFYVNQYDNMYLFVCNRITKTELAEDIIGNVFVRILQSKSNINRSLHSFIFRSLKNEIIDMYRSRRNSDLNFEVSFVYPSGYINEVKLAAECDENYFQYSIVNEAENNLLNEYLDTLIDSIENEDQKNTFNAVYVNGLTFNQHSKNINVNINTSLTRARYAKEIIIKNGGEKLEELRSCNTKY